MFYQICSDEGALGHKMAPPARVLGLNYRKIIQNLLLQNHLPQMLEIRYVALPSGPLLILYKSRSEGPNGRTPGTSGFEA